MLDFNYIVAGTKCKIFFPEHDVDIDKFENWLRQSRQALAIDTETTGLNTFGVDFKCRLVQFGDKETAWVLNTDKFSGAIHRVLSTYDRPIVMHNRVYDILVLHVCFGVDVDRLFNVTTDTYILAHLLDPRSQEEGGCGHSLKELSAKYIDQGAPDTSKELKETFRSLRYGKVGGWRRISIEHPLYLIYAGLDVLFTARLYERLEPLTANQQRLIEFEHRVNRVCAKMEQKGIRVDAEYAITLKKVLEVRQSEAMGVVHRYGVTSVDSSAEVIAALRKMDEGKYLTEKTPSGETKVDRTILLGLADLDMDGERRNKREPNELAGAILKARRAGKWAASYADPFVAASEGDERIHAKINSLLARTARMSISNPPLQQLPSGDYVVRRAIVPDSGHVIAGVDFSQIEMYILAALSRDPTMLDVVNSGQDIHDAVSRILYGDDFTSKQRKLAKNTGFGKIYGGGIDTLARQAGVDKATAQAARKLFDDSFPGIKSYSTKLVAEAQRNNNCVYSPVGRKMPLDLDRLYAGTNYMIQSTARDCFAQSLLQVDAAGLLDYALLVIHDEVLYQRPPDSEDIDLAFQEAMGMDFYGVQLKAEVDVYGSNWGRGYGATDETDAELAKIAERHQVHNLQESLW